MRAVEHFIPTTPDLMLILEPGRGLVGESGRLAVSVVGKATRGESTWLYLNRPGCIWTRVYSTG